MAVALAGVRVRTLVSQGCRPVGESYTVTAADRNLISRLAGESPVDRIRATFAAADLIVAPDAAAAQTVMPSAAPSPRGVAPSSKPTMIGARKVPTRETRLNRASYEADFRGAEAHGGGVERFRRAGRGRVGPQALEGPAGRPQAPRLLLVRRGQRHLCDLELLSRRPARLGRIIQCRPNGRQLVWQGLDSPAVRPGLRGPQRAG